MSNEYQCAICSSQLTLGGTCLGCEARKRKREQRKYCVFCGDLMTVDQHCFSCEQRSLQRDRRGHRTHEQRISAYFAEILEILVAIIQSNISGAKFMASIDEQLQALISSENTEKTNIATLAGVVASQQATITNLQETISNLSKDENRLTDAQRTTLDLAVADSKANTADVQTILGSLATGGTAVNVDPPQPPVGTATEVPA